MVKWADYLISAVSYDTNRIITQVEIHEDLDGIMGPAKLVSKLDIAHNIRKGKTYVTIYKSISTCKRGERVNLFSVNGNPYLRIDQNKVNLDNLGDILNLDDTKKKLDS